ncbi:Polycystin-1, partial [Anas platyrhynchos]
VTFRNEDIFVRAKDVFSIQHSAGLGSFLQCQPSPTSPNKTNFFSTNSSDWAFGLSALPACARDTNDTWFAVLSLSGLREGASSHVLVAENAVSSQNITVVVKVEEPIRGLRATPDPESRVLLNTRVSYVPVMEAGSDVTFRWTVDDKPSFTFYNVVFNVIYQSPAVYKLSCARDTNDTWFAVLSLSGLREGASSHVLVAENAVSSQNITVVVKVEEPIRGLRATPDPESRVLLNTRVVSGCRCC